MDHFAERSVRQGQSPSDFFPQGCRGKRGEYADRRAGEFFGKQQRCENGRVKDDVDNLERYIRIHIIAMLLSLRQQIYITAPHVMGIFLILRNAYCLAGAAAGDDHQFHEFVTVHHNIGNHGMRGPDYPDRCQGGNQCMVIGTVDGTVPVQWSHLLTAFPVQYSIKSLKLPSAPDGSGADGSRSVISVRVCAGE